MDYNNIKQLIARYWEGDTCIEEDQEIKRFFFEHTDLPEELEKWRAWFSNLSNVSNAGLDADFDARIIDRIEAEAKKGKTVFFPRFKVIAAACIALTMVSIAGWKVISHQSEKQERLAMVQAKADYEQIKNMLYFTSSKMNETEKAIQENFSKIDRMNEIININK